MNDMKMRTLIIICIAALLFAVAVSGLLTAEARFEGAHPAPLLLMGIVGGLLPLVAAFFAVRRRAPLWLKAVLVLIAGLLANWVLVVVPSMGANTLSIADYTTLVAEVHAAHQVFRKYYMSGHIRKWGSEGLRMLKQGTAPATSAYAYVPGASFTREPAVGRVRSTAMRIPQLVFVSKPITRPSGGAWRILVMADYRVLIIDNTQWPRYRMAFNSGLKRQHVPLIPPHPWGRFWNHAGAKGSG